MSFCRSLAAIRISRLAFELPPSFPFGEERERLIRRDEARRLD